MTIKKFARWASLAAALSMPLTAFAQDQGQPAPTQGQDQNQQMPGENTPTPQGQQPGEQQPGEQQPGEQQPGTEQQPGAQPESNQPGATQGNQGQNQQMGKAGKISQDQIEALAFVHQVNQAEIDAGKMAEKQGSSKAVKDYGKTLQTDHKAIDKDITSFAKQNKIKLPKESKLSQADQSQLKDLKQQASAMKKLKGTNFDQQFLQNMAQDHEQVLAKVDSAISNTQDPQLQTLLKEKVKPVLQAHADRARELLKSNAQAMR